MPKVWIPNAGWVDVPDGTPNTEGSAGGVVDPSRPPGYTPAQEVPNNLPSNIPYDFTPKQNTPTSASTTGPSEAPTTTSGGGGSGGGGGNAGAGGIGGPLGDQYSVQKTLMEELSKAMSGQSSRYNEQNMQDLYAGVISDAESGRQASQQSNYADLAARGLLRSAAATPMLQNAGAVAQKLRSEGLRQIRVEKVTADYQDKMAAIDRAQKNLDSLRQYEMGKEANQAQFAQASATIAAASIRAEADKLMQTAAFAHDTEARTHAEQKASESRDSCRDFFYSVDPSQMGDCGF